MQKLPSRVCVCVHVMYVSNFSSKPYLSRAIVIYCHLLTYFAYLNLWEVLKSQRFEWKDTVSSARGSLWHGTFRSQTARDMQILQ